MGGAIIKQEEPRPYEVHAKYSAILSVLPLPVLEEIFVNIPPEEVVCVCRLVCREWKEVADSAALWRERCRRDRFRPNSLTRPPTDWRLFYFLCKKRRNLLKNPIEGFSEWEILENVGDKWSIEPLSEPFPDGKAAKCFVTNDVCEKWQVINLVKEGYSHAFMDVILPGIVISDWYCGTMYEICVELLNQNKEVICKFCPEPTYFEQRNDQKWRQITHVFRDYGRGVRFIRFCHGGNKQTWLGWYGIQVTNSSVEICPPASSLNLLKNPIAEERFSEWEILENVGDNWTIEPLSEPLPDGKAAKYFVTSGGVCEKWQVIDLVKEGYSHAFMDEIQPDIVISDCFTFRWEYDCGSMYEICVELLNQNKEVIYDPRVPGLRARRALHQVLSWGEHRAILARLLRDPGHQQQRGDLSIST